MGKIGYSSVTLTDLTETLPVTLVLETNLDQNIQTKVGNLYTPNFEEKELIITPSLFLGQEEILFSKHPEYLKPESETDSGYLYYEIGDTVYKWTGNFNSSIYVDDEGKLHIKENLTANTTIEAYIEDFYEPTHNYTVDLVSRVNPINILFLEEGNDNYYAVIECSGGREHFEDTNANAITMTVKLYQGLINLLETRLNDFEIKWDKLSDGDNNADSTATQLTVERSKITNRELFTCEIKDKATGITYTAQQFIYDFTDQYNCVITYDKPLLLSEENTEVNLSATVWYKNERLEGKTGYKLSYRWMVVGEKDGEDKNLSGNESTIKISSNDINIPQKQAFTVLCQVLHTDSAGSQYIIANGVVTFQWIPSYSVRISPKDIFVVTGSDGSYQGNTNKQYTFNFQLVDKQGNLINYDTSDNQSESVSAGTNSDGTKITFSNPKNNKWDFTGTITLSNALWSSTDGSRAYEFTYVYYGQQFTEEVNIIKNKTGAQGIQGFSGYTVDLSNEFHAFSGGEGHADPNQSTSCKISAYYGSEGRTIQSIKLGSQIIYQLNTTPSLVTYHSSDYGYLYIQARKEQDHIIELTIRTNNSTTEAGKFLVGIRPLSFDVTILNTKNEKLVFPKVFTYTINYNGKSYSLVPSHNFIKYSEAEGIYEPSKITVSATMRQESGESVAYSGAKIIYSFDGTNWKNYTTAGISSYANLQNIYLRLYSSQATFSSNPTSDLSNNVKYLLDTETIPILTSLEGYQIGGENLLRWTKEMPVETNKWSYADAYSQVFTTIDSDGFSAINFVLNGTESSNTWYGFHSPKISLTEDYLNKTFCFSCLIKAEDINRIAGCIAVQCHPSSEAGRSGRRDFYFSGLNFEKKESNTWIKMYFTFTINSDFFLDFASTPNTVDINTVKFFSIGFWPTGNSKKILFKKAKLELGNIPSSWSASPYDLTYGDLVGANLITSNSLSYMLDNIQNSTSSYLTLAPILQPNSYYTLSWRNLQRLKSGNIEYGLFSNNSYSFLGNLNSTDQKEIIFQTKTSEAQLYFLVPSEEQLIFSNLKLEKGQYSSSYILTESELNERFENSKKYTTEELAKLQIPGFIPETITEKITVPDPDNPNKTKEITTSYTAYKVTDANNNSILLASLADLKDYVKNLKNEINENGATLTSTKQGLIETQNGLSMVEGRIQLNNDNPSDPYLLISTAQEGNIISMQLHNNELGFYNEGTKVAYFSAQKLYITQADITTTLRIGTSTEVGGQGYLVFTTVKETGVTVTWSKT